ncbi:efflux transporter outer membrane subunit [Deferrisoma sp.]
MSPRAVWGGLLVAATLAGCAGPAELTRPEPPVPLEARTFSRVRAEAAGRVLAHRWWRTFGDPALDGFVERVVEGNLDLRRAAARVREARAAAARAGAARLPTVTGSLGAQRTRTPGEVRVGDRVNDSYDLTVSLSWEADLWGRVANLEQAARLDLEAARDDAERAYHLVVAEAVRAWLDLAAAREKTAVVERMLEADRQRLAVVESRYRRGLVPAADVHQGRQLVEDDRARLALLRQEREVAAHRLMVLMGAQSAEYEDSAPTLPPPPPPVPAGLPSDLLWRRPDLRAAERRALAGQARAAAADADRYPRFALTASGGRSSDVLRDLSLGTNTFWTLIANLAQPLFDAGSRKAALAEAEARAEQARLAWGQAVLAALQEVEDALSVEAAQRERLAALEESRRHAERAVETATLRYRRGLEDLTRTLVARRTLLAAELEKVETRHQLCSARVSLLLSLGGAWGDEDRVAGEPAANPIEASTQRGDP